jgi:hypothetical protein
VSNTVRVSDDEDEAESADFVVCVLATDQTPFTDNVFAFCCKCDVKVQHRPHAPKAPKKICMACAMPDMEAEAAKGELEIVATSRTAHEVASHFSRNKGGA